MGGSGTGAASAAVPRSGGGTVNSVPHVTRVP